MSYRPTTVAAIGGTLVCVALLTHAVLAAIIILKPEASVGHRVLTMYRRFVVLGPFFQESRITTAQHVLISLYDQGEWNAPADYACREVAASRHGKYGALQRRNFEKYLVWRSSREKRPGTSTREMENFLRSRVSGRGDSLEVVLVSQYSRAGFASGTDTVYTHKFKR